VTQPLLSVAHCPIKHLAIALILSAVFIPVAFLGDITGQIYRNFALTIAVGVGRKPNQSRPVPDHRRWRALQP
jgi:AcrB/AcrD/AcrF family protein